MGKHYRYYRRKELKFLINGLLYMWKREGESHPQENNYYDMVAEYFTHE